MPRAQPPTQAITAWTSIPDEYIGDMFIECPYPNRLARSLLPDHPSRMNTQKICPSNAQSPTVCPSNYRLTIHSGWIPWRRSVPRMPRAQLPAQTITTRPSIPNEYLGDLSLECQEPNRLPRPLPPYHPSLMNTSEMSLECQESNRCHQM